MRGFFRLFRTDCSFEQSLYGIRTMLELYTSKSSTILVG